MGREGLVKLEVRVRIQPVVKVGTERVAKQSTTRRAPRAVQCDLEVRGQVVQDRNKGERRPLRHHKEVLEEGQHPQVGLLAVLPLAEQRLQQRVRVVARVVGTIAGKARRVGLDLDRQLVHVLPHRAVALARTGPTKPSVQCRLERERERVENPIQPHVLDLHPDFDSKVDVAGRGDQPVHQHERGDGQLEDRVCALVREKAPLRCLVDQSTGLRVECVAPDLLVQKQDRPDERDEEDGKPVLVFDPGADSQGREDPLVGRGREHDQDVTQQGAELDRVKTQGEDQDLDGRRNPVLGVVHERVLGLAGDAGQGGKTQDNVVEREKGSLARQRRRAVLPVEGEEAVLDVVEQLEERLDARAVHKDPPKSLGGISPARARIVLVKHRVLLPTPARVQ